MTTSQVVWIVVIAIAVLILIGLVVAVRKKNLAANHERAGQLRHRADTAAADLPDASARAERAEAEAEIRRVEAQRAEEQAAVARTDAEQLRAQHEDQIRAADRLDPDVDHKAKDYAPEVADPAGPSAVPTDPTQQTQPTEPTDTSPRDDTIGTDNDTLRTRLEGDAPDRTDETTDGTHRA